MSDASTAAKAAAPPPPCSRRLFIVSAIFLAFVVAAAVGLGVGLSLTANTPRVGLAFTARATVFMPMNMPAGAGCSAPVTTNITTALAAIIGQPASSISCSLAATAVAARVLQTTGNPVNCAPSVTPTVIQYAVSCTDTSAGSCAAAIVSTLNSQVYAPGSTSLQPSLSTFNCMNSGSWPQATAIQNQSATYAVSYVSLTASITLSSSVPPSSSVSTSVTATVTRSPSVSSTTSGSATPTVTRSNSASASRTAASSSATPSLTPSPSHSCNLYVSDKGTGTVYLLPGGNAAKNISLPFPPLVSPAGIFVNASNKDVYVAGDSQVVRIPGGTGTPIALPLPALTPIFGAWSEARDVFQDARGTLWVTNFANNYGTPSVVAIPAAAPSFYLVPTAYTWVCPHSITVSSDGTIFVSDFCGAAIVRITSWGFGNTTIFADNNLIAQPTGIWLAPNGNLIVTDFVNMVLLRLAFTGDAVAITTLGGSPLTFWIDERPTDVGGSPWLSLFIAQHERSQGLLLVPSTAIGSLWINLQGVWADC